MKILVFSSLPFYGDKTEPAPFAIRSDVIFSVAAHTAESYVDAPGGEGAPVRIETKGTLLIYTADGSEPGSAFVVNDVEEVIRMWADAQEAEVERAADA